MNDEDVLGAFLLVNNPIVLSEEEIKDVQKAIKQLQQENRELKQKLNWIAFGDDAELALRYLRKIGYVDFDEERKVYINKHNNKPFVLDEEEEKAYYIKSEELNEYTEQLEYQNKELKEQLEEYQLQNIDLRADIMIQKKAFPNKLIKDKTFYDLYNMPTYEDLLHQQKEFTSYLEKIIEELECDDVDDEEMKGYLIQRIDTFKEILQKYKNIIGVLDDNKTTL